MKSEVTYFTKEELEQSSPSKNDGIDTIQEAKLRKTFVKLLQDACTSLKLPTWVFETAVVYCHRFFARRSMNKNDRFLVSAAALLLACKTEECPRALKDVAQVCLQYKLAANKQTNKATQYQLLHDATYLDALMENILKAERSLMFTLDFKFGAMGRHMVDLVVPLSKDIGLYVSEEAISPEEYAVRHKFHQMSINFINDSLKTTLSLQFPSRTIAAACVRLAARQLRAQLTPAKLQTVAEVALHNYGLTAEDFAAIEPQIMSLYDVPKMAGAAELPAHKSLDPLSSGGGHTDALPEENQQPSPAPATPATDGKGAAPTAQASPPHHTIHSSAPTESPEEGELVEAPAPSCPSILPSSQELQHQQQQDANTADADHASTSGAQHPAPTSQPSTAQMATTAAPSAAEEPTAAAVAPPSSADRLQNPAIGEASCAHTEALAAAATAVGPPGVEHHSPDAATCNACGAKVVNEELNNSASAAEGMEVERGVGQRKRALADAEDESDEPPAKRSALTAAGMSMQA